MADDSLISPYGDEPQVQAETCDPASKCCSPCLATKIVRGALAFLVIGTAGVYGAITAKPEMAEYLSFLPGMSGGDCPISAMFGGKSCSASCAATSSGTTSACSSHSECPATSACSVASRAAMLETCSQLNAAATGDTGPEIVLADTVFEVDAAPAAEQLPAE